MAIEGSFCDHNPHVSSIIQRMAIKPQRNVVCNSGMLIIDSEINIRIVGYSGGLEVLECGKCGNMVGVKIGKQRFVLIDLVKLGDKLVSTKEVLRQILNEHMIKTGTVNDLTLVTLKEGKGEMIELRILDCMSEMVEWEVGEGIATPKKYWKVLLLSEGEITPIKAEVVSVTKKAKFVSEATFSALKEMLKENTPIEAEGKLIFYITVN